MFSDRPAAASMTRRLTPLGLLGFVSRLLFLVSTTLTGCADVMVRPAQPFSVLDAVQASLSVTDSLSPRTLQTLRRLDIEEEYHRDPRQGLARLQQEAEREPQPETLFALAEICYSLGQRAESNAEKDACCFYYLCAGYAYHYLFDGLHCAALPHADLANGDSAIDSDTQYDPRYRLACDLYNASLAQCIKSAQRAGRLDPRERLQVPTPDGKGFTLTVRHHGFDCGSEEFGELLFCSDFNVVGLPNQYRRYGLGVPLIGTRVASKPLARHAFYPDAISFPVSAFFRFEGNIADLRQQHSGTLELYNPLAVPGVQVGKQMVPLETDLTTPLAYFLSRTDLQTTEYKGFLSPDTVEARAGIYMFEPYQPGKIPVIMIHGLLSSPLTWAPLFNDLRADPELRKHFQFWFYLYPTGPGYLQAAADLRRDLAQLRTELDPHGTDASFEQMVLVGHSMGGLVSRLMTVDSRDDFWHLASQRPLDELKIDPPVREELRRLFYFERQPCVRRVIYIATPHRGSRLSPSAPGRLAAELAQAPQLFAKTAEELMKADPGDNTSLETGKLATSVDLLAPGSSALDLLVARPRPKDVQFHSVIGRALPGTLLREVTRPFVGNEKSDGVVPYTSAHLDDVASEITVPADHIHVHHHPLAVREVRRILLEHANAAGATVADAEAPPPIPVHEMFSATAAKQ
jgi:pimeloyl-ACP methyl ester carboxylesterase